MSALFFCCSFRLPLPWLLYAFAFGHGVKVSRHFYRLSKRQNLTHLECVAKQVSATGMICSIAILFGMLLLVFFSILIFNWKMTKGMGFSMFILYFVFVAVSLGFEYDLYQCPL